MAVHCKQHAMNFVCGGCIVLKMLVIEYYVIFFALDQYKNVCLVWKRWLQKGLE